MSLSRRYFIQLSSLSLLAGTLFSSARAEGQSEDDGPFNPGNLATLDGVSMQTFEPYIGDQFTVSLNGQNLGQLTLVSVTDENPGVGAGGGWAGRAQRLRLTGFRLFFRGTGQSLNQETYTLEQSALGKFPVLLVPGNPAVYPLTYEAFFIRFVAPVSVPHPRS